MRYIYFILTFTAASLVFWSGYRLGVTEPPLPLTTIDSRAALDQRCNAISDVPVEEADEPLKKYLLEREGCGTHYVLEGWQPKDMSGAGPSGL